MTFPRFSAPARALLLVVFAVAAGALAIAMNLGSFIWSCAVATVLAAISAAAYAISRNLARWRRLSKPQRLSIVDELFARGLISAEESDALRLRIELIFEAAGRKSIVQHDET